jgi:hypothetical protein
MEDHCFICLDHQDTPSIFCGCKFKVHMGCLKKWVKTSRSKTCQICGKKYDLPEVEKKKYKKLNDLSLAGLLYNNLGIVRNMLAMVDLVMFWSMLYYFCGGKVYGIFSWWCIFLLVFIQKLEFYNMVHFTFIIYDIRSVFSVWFLVLFSWLYAEDNLPWTVKVLYDVVRVFISMCLRVYVY